ncbi:protein FAR1-RELATED SEQUENCE 5-like [Beta vulgaris subsp. vulgaris]|uniref:protein FAR1-RELATED SEQUENCE 5-like n=1 Tax=Beta vulgaris subsp. vulgaris TaxID=3555 RepID=UPI002036EECD|nr:protein FAR1-RELATED SEQUENCE 5-like [Beta vulgaris subsp. vulgaris]
MFFPERVGDGINYNLYFDNSPELETCDVAAEWCKIIAFEFGFFLIISSHKKKYQLLDYDRDKKKKLRDFSSAIRRKTKRKACGCEFRLFLVPKNNYTYWVVETKVEHGFHNRPMMLYPEGNRQISGLSPVVKKLVRKLTSSHVKPHHIMKAVEGAFPSLNPNVMDIYNCRDVLRRVRSEGRNVVQQFLQQAVQSKYLFWLHSDEMCRVIHTFIAHPTSVNLVRTYPHVIHIDATYKTNKYLYPFVEILGVTPTNKNFLVACALSQHEDAQSYRWMLERLKNLIGIVALNAIVTDRNMTLCKYISHVFPTSAHLLYTWHINDVEAWVTKKFGGKRKIGVQFGRGCWARVMKSKTEVEYEINVANIMEEWGCTWEYFAR